MKTIILTIALSVATVTAFACLANAADKKPTPKTPKAEQGKVIPRDELPESIKAQSGKKESKFPGIPSCAKGRVLTDWGTVMDLDESYWTKGAIEKHVCGSAKQIYACAAFGKISVRCE